MEVEEHLATHGRLREDIGMNTYLHGPMDHAKTLKLQGPGPARKKRYTGSREGGGRCAYVLL